MIYIIDNKPYVKVSYYYKLVEIAKSKDGYNVVPKGGEETRIELQNAKNVKEVSIEEYMKHKRTKIVDIEE